MQKRTLEIEVCCNQTKDLSNLISNIRNKGYEVRTPRGINGFFVRFLEDTVVPETVEAAIISEIRLYENTLEEDIGKRGYTVRILESPRAL